MWLPTIDIACLSDLPTWKASAKSTQPSPAGALASCQSLHLQLVASDGEMRSLSSSGWLNICSQWHDHSGTLQGKEKGWLMGKEFQASKISGCSKCCCLLLLGGLRGILWSKVEQDGTWCSDLQAGHKKGTEICSKLPACVKLTVTYIASPFIAMHGLCLPLLCVLHSSTTANPAANLRSNRAPNL